MISKKELKIGIISDGKYGERAFKNISEKYQSKWIMVPDIEPNIMIDDDLNLDIPTCDIYISYVRHPDIILFLAELQKPLILGVLPGVGLYRQAKDINPLVIHAPTMCSLDTTTGIKELDLFLEDFGRPDYEVLINEEGIIKEIKVKRASFCGSSNAGGFFLKDKKITTDNLEQFALHVCHECRAPRFGHTCDKEVAGIIHLIALFEKKDIRAFSNIDNELTKFIADMTNEYEKRMKSSREIIQQVR